jgi:A/G-specific adenine glycosylase
MTVRRKRRLEKVRRASRRTILKARINTALLRWYRNNARKLPWRGERDPYRILLSEVMLQQTQVARVLEKYPLFLDRFPTLRRLARARISAVIKAWRGMGYNHRALRLQKLAGIVVNDFNSKLPENISELASLPGVGRYTAHALACFAFGKSVAVVDTNVARVLNRLYLRANPRTSSRNAYVWRLAERHLPRRNAHDWNQALMDLGATTCTAAKPRCIVCPLSELCPSAHKVPLAKNHVRRLEPGRNGIPNRIYRGRIVEVLRNLRPGSAIASSVLARAVKADLTTRDRRWFEALLRSLEQDGLVRRRGGTRVSLPD